MEKILFALPGNELLAERLAKLSLASLGTADIRRFPDGESYVRIESPVEGKMVVLVCSLDRPDEKLLPLFFLSRAAKELGAYCTCLVAPYLAYMRQDKRFKTGEGITSAYFAWLISQFADRLITVDPHLHRRSALSEIYSVPTEVLHAAPHISRWIRQNISNPLLIGPDAESEQWVRQVAYDAGAPCVVLEKVRHGDRDVRVSVPKVEAYLHHTPVLVDDIISTARTMIETLGHLRTFHLQKPICIGVHGIFASSAYQELLDAGAGSVITTNTVAHPSNEIDISDLIAHALEQSHLIKADGHA